VHGRGLDYFVYGLKLRAGRALPHLLPAPDRFRGHPPDIHVHLGDEERPPGPDDLPDAVRLRYSTPQEAIDFVISGDGTRIWGDWTEAAPVARIDDVAALLLGPVLGCALRLRGTVSLHGCAVAVGARAAVILAEHGVGKSTLAAALAREGHRVLSDDLAAITEGAAGWTVHPGYPRLRLRPDAIAAFNLARAATAPVFTGQEKRYMPLSTAAEDPGWRFGAERVRIGAIYALASRPDLDTPVIQALRGADGLMTLLRHRSASFAILGQGRQADELASLGRLAGAVPLRRVHRPDGLEHLPGLCQAILEDQASCL
jgi:hypothetical protein